MENNENFVEQTENVERTTEQTVTEPAAKFTQEDMSAAVGKAKARERAKIEKQYKREYGELVEVLKAGTGKENVGEITDTFREFYRKKGVPLREKPSYTEQDIVTLARADADEFISAGYEDVVEEVDRLSEVGYENLTPREKAVFKTLADYRQNTEQARELSGIGVTEDVYNSAEFKDFAKKFNANIPISDVYDIYRQTQPQKEIRTMGSMKTTPAPDSGVKEFYTVEEARRFTKADYDKNPALFAAVERSMQKWKK